MSAACLQASARDGVPTTLNGPFQTVMAGLRCGEVSRSAFTATHSLVDAYVAIEDEWAIEATRALALPADTDPRIEAGASGAAALGGLMASLRTPAAADLRTRIALGAQSRILVFVTEGVTDAAAFTAALADCSTPR